MKQSAYVMNIATKIAAEHEFFRDALGVKNIAVIVQEAFEAHGIVQRLAERISVGEKGRKPYFDAYAGYTPKMREFAEKMDLWTLEQVIVRVMTDIDRRRRKHLGGVKKMAEHLGKPGAPP